MIIINRIIIYVLFQHKTVHFTIKNNYYYYYNMIDIKKINLLTFVHFKDLLHNEKKTPRILLISNNNRNVYLFTYH